MGGDWRRRGGVGALLRRRGMGWPTMTRLIAKADTMLAAWRARFKTEPTRRAIFVSCAVAEHETNQGDAWPGEHNYGAVQWRVPTDEERQRIASGELRAGSRIPGGALHIDSSPSPTGPRWYPCWFRAFDSDLDGAQFFLGVLVNGQTAPDLARGDCAMVAFGMYMHGYYEGNHAPGRPRSARTSQLTPGESLNVADYARAVRRCYDAIALACAGWGLDLEDAPPVAFDGHDEQAAEEHRLAVAAGISALEEDLRARDTLPEPREG